MRNTSGSSREQNGAAFIYALFAMVLLAMIAASAFNMTAGNVHLALREETRLQAVALAEGSLEIAYAQWRRYMENHLDFTNAAPPNGNDLRFIESNPPTTISSFRNAFNRPEGNYMVDEYRVVPLDENGNPYSDLSQPPAGVASQTDSTSGLNNGSVRIYRYLATVQVRRAGLGATVPVRIGRTFEVRWAPLVTNAIFYEDRMEIHPGAPMNVIGTVHSNSPLHYGTDNPGNLTFYERVSSASSITNSYYDNRSNPNDASWRGTSPFATAGDRQPNTPRQEPVGVNPEDVFDRNDTNLNNDSFRELIERPDGGSADPENIADLRFYNQADIKIEIDSSLRVSDANYLKIFKKTYNGDPSAKTPVSSTDPLFQNIRGTIVTPSAVDAGTIITDGREANPMFLTSVDVNALTRVLGSASGLGSGGSGFNGILYVTDVSSASNGGVSPVPLYNAAQRRYDTLNAEKAIRLRNGSVFDSSLTNTNNPNGGFTVASANAFYVQGDYNSGRTSSSGSGNTPANNNSTPPTSDNMRANNGLGDSTYNGFPEATGYDRKPSMIAGDAVTILSNAWNDTNSSLGISSRVASRTTVNTAIITGNVPTPTQGSSQYSGGVENFPRFLENWSGVRFTYYGSLIQLFQSVFNNGRWPGTGTVYNAPSRLWAFDTNFRRKLPPGVAVAITNGRGRLIELPPR